DRVAELEKQNRALERKLQRLEANARQSESIHHANSKLLSTLSRELEDERAKSLALLQNILPQAIIDRLEGGEQTIADRYSSITALFSDCVGFTQISSSFDALCEEHGVEKIKTIGDAYLAVGGLPGTRHDHVAAVAELALAMVDAV